MLVETTPVSELTVALDTLETLWVTVGDMPRNVLRTVCTLALGAPFYPGILG